MARTAKAGVNYSCLHYCPVTRAHTKRSRQPPRLCCHISHEHTTAGLLLDLTVETGSGEEERGMERGVEERQKGRGSGKGEDG